jgi:hypothetical protein
MGEMKTVNAQQVTGSRGTAVTRPLPPVVSCGVYFLGGILIAILPTLMTGDMTGNAGRIEYLQLAVVGTLFWLVYLLRPFLLRHPWTGVFGPLLIYGALKLLHQLPVWIGIPRT